MPRLNPAWLSGLASASLIALILLCLAWELWLAPLRPGGSWLVLKTLPLLALLFGILHGRVYTYRVASLLVWPYFTEGVMRAMTDTGPAAVLAGIEIALVLCLFVSAALFARQGGNTHPT
jgi:uncharacterized membrane protein